MRLLSSPCCSLLFLVPLIFFFSCSFFNGFILLFVLFLLLQFLHTSFIRFCSVPFYSFFVSFFASLLVPPFLVPSHLCLFLLFQFFLRTASVSSFFLPLPSSTFLPLLLLRQFLLPLDRQIHLRFRNGEKSLPEQNGNVEVYPASKLRQALPQCFAVCAKNLLMLTFGSTLGFPTILIPELKKENSEIPVTMEELTWISESPWQPCFVTNILIRCEIVRSPRDTRIA